MLLRRQVIVLSNSMVGRILWPFALLEQVQPAQEWALARPTGVGRAISTYTIPIEGRDEWLAAARRLA